MSDDGEISRSAAAVAALIDAADEALLRANRAARVRGAAVGAAEAVGTAGAFGFAGAAAFGFEEAAPLTRDALGTAGVCRREPWCV